MAFDAPLPDPAALGLTVLPCGPVLSAEVAGIHFTGNLLAPDLAAALRALLLRYKVLFLRDLDLSHEQHLALGGYGVRLRDIRGLRMFRAIRRSWTSAARRVGSKTARVIAASKR